MFIAHFTENSSLICVTNRFIGFCLSRFVCAGWVASLFYEMFCELLWENKLLTHLAVMAFLTGNLPIDLCCESVNGFPFEWSAVIRWIGNLLRKFLY